MLEIQSKLQEKLRTAEETSAKQEKAIQEAAREQAAAIVADMEEKAAAMESALREREAQQAAMDEAKANSEKELKEELARKQELVAAEAAARKALEESTAANHSQMAEELAKLTREREAQETAIAQHKADVERLRTMEIEREKQAAQQSETQKELEEMRAKIQQMEMENSGRAPGALKRGMSAQGFNLFKPKEEMLVIAAKKMERAAKKGRTDPTALGRVLQTLPVLSACNDLRALTELEPANRALFHAMGGIYKMVDYLSPVGPQAPYATHIARTLPCVMDAEGRALFAEYATEADALGTTRIGYFNALLTSHDPDDKEHACQAIAAIAQDSAANRKAFMDHGIAAQVIAVLHETCQQQMPRQRLQRVVVMALSELAQDFEPFKETIRQQGAVRELLEMLTPSHDPFVIKETLALMGRITQGCVSVQKELAAMNAVDVYAKLLFATTLHDAAITELGALALVNLVSEMPAAMKVVAAHPRQRTIRFEMMASMARALASSMQRTKQEHSSMDGSKQFEFWGSSRKGAWEEGCAGGDRMHTSFVDNPQFILRAKPGTNLCLVLHDVDEDKRQREKVKTRPLFLRLCVTAASEDVRSMPLEFRRRPARPPARPAHRPRTHAPHPRLCAPPHAPYRSHRSPPPPPLNQPPTVEVRQYYRDL